MKEMKNWMRAAILTFCGTLSIAMTSCTEDNASNPVENPDQSNYTLEQLQTIAHGAWLDDMQLTSTDNVRLYNIDDASTTLPSAMRTKRMKSPAPLPITAPGASLATSASSTSSTSSTSAVSS